MDHRLVIPLENSRTGKSIDSHENRWHFANLSDCLGRLAIYLWEILEDVLAENFLVIKRLKIRNNFPLGKKSETL